jgi:hypothetical protein
MIRHALAVLVLQYSVALVEWWPWCIGVIATNIALILAIAEYLRSRLRARGYKWKQ